MPTYIEIMANQVGMQPEDVALALSNRDASINFNHDLTGEKNNTSNKNINVDDYIGKTIAISTIETAAPRLAEAASVFGAETLAAATKAGVDIRSVKGFENADFNNDGKVSSTEAGSVMLAASAKSISMGSDGKPKAIVFDNDLSLGDIKKLGLDPKVMEAARALNAAMSGNRLPDGTMPPEGYSPTVTPRVPDKATGAGR